MRTLRALSLAVAVIVALTLAGCGSADKDEPDAAPSVTASETAIEDHDITVTYGPTQAGPDAGYVGTIAAQEGVTPEEFAKSILEASEITKVSEGFAEAFALPTDLEVKVVSGEGSPFYDPETKTVTLFYGFANLTANIIKANDPTITDTELGKQWASVNDFILIHELAHAFVDIFDIAIAGEEEDAADGMATFFFTDFVPGGAEYAFAAANFFGALQQFQGEPDAAQYTNEHALSVQRYATIACKVAGSSEEAFNIIGQMGVLPDSRLQRCPSEYQQLTKSWTKLLEPHLKDQGSDESTD